MKIGQFARKCGTTPKALRLYEEWGLLPAKLRSANGYRSYGPEELAAVMRIQDFKNMGFRLRDIRNLMSADQQMDFQRLEVFFQSQLENLRSDETRLQNQRLRIETLLQTFKRKSNPLEENDRQFVMQHFENILILVTGLRDLEKTAELIQSHLLRSNLKVPIRNWNGKAESLPCNEACLLTIHESLLKSDGLNQLKPDVVVIKELSGFTDEIQQNYLNLFQFAGPTLSTILNADDRASVALAASPEIRKGKTYYFSKNSGLEPQIQKIGGLISHGDQFKIFGFNQQSKPIEMKVDQILGLDEEAAYLAAMTAVLDLGLDSKALGF